MDKKVDGPFLRSGFNYDRLAASTESGLACQDASLARQSFAEECDINTIVRRFGLSGQLPEGVRMPSYGDFTGVSDFRQAVQAIALANEAFDAMPAEVRARFNNDPGQFVDFCSDEGNKEEALRLGLVLRKEAVVNPARGVPVPGGVNPTAPVASAEAIPVVVSPSGG